MSSYIPVTLEGANLKERHRYLNALVRQAYEDNVPIKDIIEMPERSAIDRIFKIDLASKYKYTEYILENLKNDDMLFVSRSLKSLWLLDPEYRNIINPSYLENILYPEMIQPAVNKMKHWLRLNLKDHERCQEFYYHYRNNFDDAINFFWHSSQNFILSELPNVIDKLTSMQLNILFEICPAACGLYFEVLPNNGPALKRFVYDEKYFMSIKYLLKKDGNLFLDIVEKYFDTFRYKPFGPSLTNFLMKNYKRRILDRIELYASSVLHLKSLALHLNNGEAKQIVLQLARAEFLNYWFSYQKVEPILKRVKVEERILLKKQLFVDKAITDVIEDWPYPKPTPLNIKEEEDYNILTDIEHHPYEYEYHLPYPCTKRSLKKRKYGGIMLQSLRMSCPIVSKGKSPLDKLFNRYRFIGFEKAFNELTKSLLAEGSNEGRLNLMLVLISKSGGISEKVEKLLRFLIQKHKNEPNTLRAAVIRSLVKRECVWRVQDQAWDLLLQLGWDLGLDGSKTELVCREGLHAVIIRHLLNDTTISPNLISGFLECFSTLSEYKFAVNEKVIIAKRLPQILFASNPGAFLDCLAEYKLAINDFPEAKPYLIKAAKEEPDLLNRLFNAKILRRELFREAFTLKQTDAMYVNVLRHDINVLDGGQSFTKLVSKERPNHDKFLQSLCLYFSEPGGLAEQHSIQLKQALEKEPNIWFVRPFCTLMPTQSLFNYLSECIKETRTDKKRLKISATIKSHIHKCKPVLDIDTVDWRVVGAGAVANKVLICREKDRQRYLKRLLARKKTAKISLHLSYNTNSDFTNVFLHVSTLRPSVAIEFGLKLLFTKDDIDYLVWSTLKSLIKDVKDLSKKTNLLRKLEDPDSVPKNVEADYWVFVFNIFKEINKKNAMPMLCHIENHLPEIDKDFVGSVLKDFINVDLNVDNFKITTDFDKILTLYFRIIAKFLLLSKSEDEEEYLMENICDRFFEAIGLLLQTEDNHPVIKQSLDEFVLALKYTKSFLGVDDRCESVLENILKRLQNILPIFKNFDTYAKIHLTMLYYKAIKQALVLKSDIFENPKNCKQGIEIVGEIFGKFIGHEIKELVSRYFRSVIEIHKHILNKYLRNYFEFNKTRSLLVTFIIKGILKAETIEAYLLAEHIFEEEQRTIDTVHCTEILNLLKDYNNVEVKFFLYAHVLNGKNISGYH